MNFLYKVIGITAAAGTAVAAVAVVKLIEKVRQHNEELKDIVYTAEAGEFPESAEEQPDEKESSCAKDSSEAYHPFNPDAELPPLPNINPVDAAAAPVQRTLDPMQIADAADFQDWDEYGCRG